MGKEIILFNSSDVISNIFSETNDVIVHHCYDLQQYIQLNDHFIGANAVVVFTPNQQISLDDFFKTNCEHQIILKNFIVLKQDNLDEIKHCLDHGIKNVFIQNNIALIKAQLFFALGLITKSKDTNLVKFQIEKMPKEQFTKKELLILDTLIHSNKNEVNKKKLCEQIWGGKVPSTNTLDVHLCNLRKKLITESLDIQSIGNGQVSLRKMAPLQNRHILM